MPSPDQLLRHAHAIDAVRAAQMRVELAPKYRSERALAFAVLLATAHPAIAVSLARMPELLPEARPLRPAERALVQQRLARLDGDELRRELRIVARRERIRIALLELLTPELGGLDIARAARELSGLAELTVQAALSEAERSIFARFGKPTRLDGTASTLVVLGMGKLGGHELNAGSDIDLVSVYDTDEIEIVGAPLDADARSANELWTRVVRRMTATLDDVSEDGFVWRVDLRLRPEGSAGPLVNSVAATERYYESFARQWERAVLLRARPVAGDLALGDALLDALGPFVWRRQVDPRIAHTMVELVGRARTELSVDPSRDLKLGPGGIREAEMFVQTLQLIWGGRDPKLRARTTVDAAMRLSSAGLLTAAEADDLANAYATLRRAEHAVQSATGQHTHLMPADEAELERLGRALGFADKTALALALATHRARISALFATLVPHGNAEARHWARVIAALHAGDIDGVTRALDDAGVPTPRDLARPLIDMARDPSSLLGVRTYELYPVVCETLLDAVRGAADPEQATRYLLRFAQRVRHPEVYMKLLAEEPAAIRRLVTVLGASAFVGEAVATRPNLADLVLFEAQIPTASDARAEIERAFHSAHALHVPDEDEEARTERLVGALRSAKRRVAVQVALADLACDLDTRDATLVLSELAEAVLEAATRMALGVGPGEPVRGLTLIAMGKLGGRDIGYGSDLDVLFLFEPSTAPDEDAVRYFTRCSRKIIHLVSMPHAEGTGYELDTRLRPSGSHGMLVVSLDAFARYHTERHDTEPTGERAATWERLALLRARIAAGDRELGARMLESAHRAAYERGGDARAIAADVHHLRERMERELGREREGRFDVKVGRGGLVDIELGVQLLQLRHGGDARVRTTDTGTAIDALAAIGALDDEDAHTLRDGYAFLRKLEQRLRIVHDDATHLLEAGAAGVVPLARRMGLGGPEPASLLIARYRHVTERIRRCYERIVGIASSASIDRRT
ncbi:MAG: bifunctional [glutamate--ammonia ligase]-adenylyl-L-tyrosine phosphorylase/[glutamate--ammonia-ligase] adenylyltransferase [Myxococcales bacterium]|nr:bifunctional [glutamate--ammonia ligase]-adenylyl-L-tyrosine phosphorylase/[glutamate--ammonia-ligase] adenylyltransferase [Myxococcales bacterium]